MGLIGAHMSIAGGIHKSLARGEEVGCESIQIFTQSNRSWATTPLTDEEIRLFKAAVKSAKGIKSVIAHNSYLINISTVKEDVRKKSVAYFIQAWERCEALEIEGLITHPGSHLGAGEEAGISATIESLNEILVAGKGFRSKLILENTAGQGDCLGHRFEQLAKIVEDCDEPDLIHFCFDTQHAFAAGYDLRTPEAYEKTFAEFDRHLSTKRIAAFHLNDAVKDIGCRVDRHENIGKGFLGLEAFRPLMNDPRFKKTPMCLETNPGDEMENYRREIPLLKSLQKVPTSF